MAINWSNFNPAGIFPIAIIIKCYQLEMFNKQPPTMGPCFYRIWKRSCSSLIKLASHWSPNELYYRGFDFNNYQSFNLLNGVARSSTKPTTATSAPTTRPSSRSTSSSAASASGTHSSTRGVSWRSVSAAANALILVFYYYVNYHFVDHITNFKLSHN